MSAEEIEQAVTKHTNNEGKLDLPKDMSDQDKFMVRHAKRTRDAQTELSKTQSQLREAEAATNVLSQRALQLTPADFGLSKEEVTALETLKHRDPESYRLQMNDLEKKAQTNKATALSEELDKVRQEASNSFKQKGVVAQLEDFRKANPTVDLSDDFLAHDVPQRFIVGFNNGDYDYSTYLGKVAEFASNGTTSVVNPSGAIDQPNLSNQAGSNKPDKEAQEKAGKKTYKAMTL